MRRFPGLLLTVCFLLFAAGCVTPLWEAHGRRWYKDGATETEFRGDLAQCEARAGAAGAAIADCLRERGYQSVAEASSVDRARDTFPSR